MYLPQALDSAASSIIESRQIGGGGYRYRTRRRTPWSSWGRWVLAGILIAAALVLLFLALCIRRRRLSKARKHGVQAPIQSHNHTVAPPMQSTYGGGYNNQQPGYGGAPPPGPPPTYGGGANNDYYGQQSGISQPAGAHYK